MGTNCYIHENAEITTRRREDLNTSVGEQLDTARDCWRPRQNIYGGGGGGGEGRARVWEQIRGGEGSREEEKRVMGWIRKGGD